MNWIMRLTVFAVIACCVAISGCDATFFKTQDVVLIIEDASSDAPVAAAAVKVQVKKPYWDECPDADQFPDKHYEGTTEDTGRAVVAVGSVTICGLGIIGCNPDEDLVTGAEYCICVEGGSGVEVIEVVLEPGREERGDLYSIFVESVSQPVRDPMD